MRERALPVVIARIGSGDEARTIRVVGREAETLLALVSRPVGIDVLCMPGGPAYRLAAYVADLRRLGLTIRTERGPHNGGTHALYVLDTAVTIVSRSDGRERAA